MFAQKQELAAWSRNQAVSHVCYHDQDGIDTEGRPYQ